MATKEILQDALRMHPEKFKELEQKVGEIRLAELGFFIARLVEKNTSADDIILRARQAFGDIFEAANWTAHSHPAEPPPKAGGRP